MGDTYQNEIIVSPYFRETVNKCFRYVLNSPFPFSEYDVHIC